jgi:transitional endoplasmic reticulum ATPase
MRAGRLDYILRFPIPNEGDRLEIFQVHTREKPLGSDVDLRELARLTEGMVGSEIASVCRSAAMIAIAEAIREAEKKVSMKLLINAHHFKSAIRQLKEKEESSHAESGDEKAGL